MVKISKISPIVINIWQHIRQLNVPTLSSIIPKGRLRTFPDLIAMVVTSSYFLESFKLIKNQLDLIFQTVFAQFLEVRSKCLLFLKWLLDSGNQRLSLWTKVLQSKTYRNWSIFASLFVWTIFQNFLKRLTLLTQ